MKSTQKVKKQIEQNMSEWKCVDNSDGQYYVFDVIRKHITENEDETDIYNDIVEFLDKNYKKISSVKNGNCTMFYFVDNGKEYKKWNDFFDDFGLNWSGRGDLNVTLGRPTIE